ncbi:hypothetical protein LX36DRAFT_473659 [Colletotrichum falcatum]|nr:hypothetical protein LX36DRAFT_473659 [Colletotrichum falcatum]
MRRLQKGMTAKEAILPRHLCDWGLKTVNQSAVELSFSSPSSSSSSSSSSSHGCSDSGLFPSRSSRVQAAFINHALRQASLARESIITSLLGWDGWFRRPQPTRYFVSRHSFVPCRTSTHPDQIPLGPPPPPPPKRRRNCSAHVMQIDTMPFSSDHRLIPCWTNLLPRVHPFTRVLAEFLCSQDFGRVLVA